MDRWMTHRQGLDRREGLLAWRSVSACASACVSLLHRRSSAACQVCCFSFFDSSSETLQERSVDGFTDLKKGKKKEWIPHTVDGNEDGRMDGDGRVEEWSKPLSGKPRKTHVWSTFLFFFSLLLTQSSFLSSKRTHPSNLGWAAHPTPPFLLFLRRPEILRFHQWMDEMNDLALWINANEWMIQWMIKWFSHEGVWRREKPERRVTASLSWSPLSSKLF